MMRIWAATVVCLATVLSAQQTSRQHGAYTYDLNGRRVPVRSTASTATPGETSRTERIQSINGRPVPLESVEEKVLSEGPDGRVVERVVRPYDQTGQPGPPEKIRIEERKRPDGGTTIRTTSYRGDLNGRFALWERSTTEAAKTGDILSSSTVVERPAPGGSLEVVEKQVVVEKEKDEGSSRDVTTYRRDPSGRFYEAARETTEVVVEDNRQTHTTDRYDAANTGRLEFVGKTVSNLEKHADGSESQLVSVYGRASMGRPVGGYSAGPQLRQQHLIERRKGPGGEVVETFSIRRGTLADSGRLGEFEKISEVVCTGNCENDNDSRASGKDKERN